MLNKVVLFFGLLSCLHSGVVCLLVTDPVSDNGLLTLCPGEPISITCSHDNDGSGVTRWIVDGSTGADCDETVSHSSDVDDDICGLFTITMISDSTPFNSTAMATATSALSGATVSCFDRGTDIPAIGSVNITVLDIPTPTITSVEQVSQSVVRVNMSVTDTQCVDSYVVEATPVGGSGSTNTSSPTSTVDVSGLDVCQYNYSLVGSAQTARNYQSELTSPIIFSANLSVLNEVTVTVNQVEPIIEWVQMDNPLYPTCITGYEIVDDIDTLSLDLRTTVDSATRSITSQQLNTAGFPYCIQIRPSVTPFTPMEPLMTFFDESDPNTYVTVMDPDFPTPMLTPYFSLNESIVTLLIAIQNISMSIVQVRQYQFTTNGATSSVMIFTGDYFEIELPEAEGGQRVQVTVIFSLEACQDRTTANFTVPAMEITDIEEAEPTDTSQTVTITLPLTEYQPEQLLIISTVNPPDDGPIVADFTSPSMQYTVTFTDLDPATEYTFTIRIVLRSDVDTDVVPPATGAFTTAPTSPPTTEESPSPTSSGCGGGCIAGIIVAIVVVVIIIVIVVIVVVVVVVLPNRTEGQYKPGEQELKKHETPETVKVEIVPESEGAQKESSSVGNQ